ncbi:hypothetical protein F4775DRAFT_546853, partial [Biscogniauxia sp. FL1348]
MMPREGRRRRSPETSRRRRKERRNSREAGLQSQQIPVHTATYDELEQVEPLPLPTLSRVPSTPNSTTSLESSSSSTSSSLVNISQPLQRFGFGSFFSGGSQQQEHRAKKKKKKRSRFLRFGNSSSSSLGSDLAYGKGYIDRRRSSREFSPPSKQKRRRPSPPKRSGTDEEIIELGRKFAEIARQQQMEDLKASGKNRSSPAASYSHRSNNGHQARGIGNPRAHRESSSDDSEWESASEDESSSEDNDSGLAYGSVPSSLEKRVHVRSPTRSRTEPVHNAPIRHKRSLVDPKLFGPVNSLHGYVNSPCGFETVDRDAITSPRQHYEPSIAPSETIPVEAQPLQQLYPVPTSDPSQFDADRGSVVSAQQDFTRRSQPWSVPLQQPKPIVPVPTRVFESVDTDPGYSRRSSTGDSLAKAAMAGIAGAALSAALNADKKNESSKYEERRERSEKRTKQPNIGDLDDREEKRKTRDQLRDDRREYHREKDVEVERTYEKETYRQEKSNTETDRESEKERLHQDKYHEDIDLSREHVRSTVERNDEQQNTRLEDRKERREEQSREQKSTSRSSKEATSKHSVESDYRPPAGSVDPFQFQVADDAFPTPLHTTPKRSPTPNIVTIDREPDFSDLKFSHDPPRERLSRKDSYELELHERRDIASEQSPTPANEAVPAVPAATLTTDDHRGRRRGRGGDSSSRHRSRHSESPRRSRDRVQDDADRVWREEMLARRIRDESKRSRSNSPDSSVVDKWNEAVTEKRNEAGDSQGFEIVAPPETDSSKKEKSLYDGPNADVRVDNIFQNPNQLALFQPPDSAEHERLVLNIIRPTPAPTPRSDEEKPKDYFVAEKSSESREQTKVEVSKPAIDVGLGSQGEVISRVPTPAPESLSKQVPVPASEQTHHQASHQAMIPSLEQILEEALEPAPEQASEQVQIPVPASAPQESGPGTASKAVSWGENQTKRYALESPERAGDNLPGAKVTVPPETPKVRSGKKSNPWRTLANVVSIGGAGAAASVTKTTVDAEMTRQHVKSEDREELPRSRSSLQYDTDDNPPIPGPKPTSPRNAQMPGTFAEDPSFTATIAAGLEGSGFDPNIVIDDANFHKRDSAPGSNELIEPPVIGEPSQIVQEPEPIVNDPPKAPAEKNGLSIHNSAILLKLVEKLKRKQQAKSKAKKGSSDKNSIMESSSAVQTDASRSSIEDNSSISSAKLRKDTHDKGDSNLRSEIRQDGNIAEDVPSKQKLPSELQFETRPQLYDSEADDKSGNASPRKKSKRLRKTIPAQQEQRHLKEAESSSASIPVDGPQEAQDAQATRPDSKWDFLKLGKMSKNIFDANISMTMIPEDVQNMLAGSDKMAERGPDTIEPPTRPSLSSELSRDSSYRMVGSESTSIYEDEQSTPTGKKPRKEPQLTDPPPRFALAPETSIASRKEINDDIVSMPNDEWSPLKKSKHRRNSFAADSPSTSEVSVQPAWRHSLDEYHPASSVETGDGWDFLRRSKEVVQHESGAWGSPAYPKPTVEDVAESPKETTESLYDMRSVKTAVTGGRDTPKLNQSNGDSTPYQDFPSPSLSQFKESMGTLRSSRWDSHMGSISSTRRPTRRRSLSGVFPDEDYTPAEEEPPDRRSDSFPFRDNDASSIVSDSTFYTGHISTRSRCPGDDLDDADSVASEPTQDIYDSQRPTLTKINKRNAKGLGLFGRFRSSIGITEKERSSARKPEEDGKNSFLANAGTLGAGAGLADTAIAVASQGSGSKATDAPSEKEAPSVPITPERRLSSSQLIDPEIVEREIRPAIDPLYGDLLPLPPTTPGTPVPELGDDIPPLPESRPGTPESDLERRLLSGKSSHIRRRSDNAIRARTPSQSAVPIHFRLKTTPTSPGNLKSSALTSPTTISPEHESPSRTRVRPPSRDSTKAVKPLLLVQKASRELMEASGQSQEDSIASRGFMHDTTLHALGARDDANFSEMPMLSNEPVRPPENVPSTTQTEPDNKELTTMSEADSVPHSPSDVFHDLPIINAREEDPSTDKTSTIIPHHRTELPYVEIHRADDSGLQEATANFMGSPQLPSWELTAPIGNLSPIPEPFDPMSKDRSSDLFHSSPSTHKFSDFDISEGGPSFEPAQEGTETSSITEHVPGDDMQDTSVLVAAAATSGVTGELIASSVHDKQDHSGQFSKEEGVGSNESKHVLSSRSDYEAKANLSKPTDNLGAHEKNIQDSDADISSSVSTPKLKGVQEELSDIDDEIDTPSSKATQVPRELPLGPRAGLWSGALPSAGLPSWSGAVSMLKGVPRWSLGTPRRESLPETTLPASPKEDQEEEKLKPSDSVTRDDVAETPSTNSPILEGHHEQFFDAIADQTHSKQGVGEVEATIDVLGRAKPDEAKLEAGGSDTTAPDRNTGIPLEEAEETSKSQTAEPTIDEQSNLATPQELTLTEHLVELLNQPATKDMDATASFVEPAQSFERAPLEEIAQELPLETQLPLQDQPETSVPRESVSTEVDFVEPAVATKRSKKKKKKGKKTETQEPNAEHGYQATDVLDHTSDQQDPSPAHGEPFVQSQRDSEAPHQSATSRPSSPPAHEQVSLEDTVDHSKAELQQPGAQRDELVAETHPLKESSTDVMASSDSTSMPTENTVKDGRDKSSEELSATSHPLAQGELAAESQFDSKLEFEMALDDQLLNSNISSQDNKVVESTIQERIEAKDDMEVPQAPQAIESSLQVGNSQQISESKSLDQADVEQQSLQPNIGGEPQTELHAARSGPHSDPQTETAPAENLHDNTPHVEAVDNLLTSQATTDETAPTLPHPSSTEDLDAGNSDIEEPIIEQSKAEAVVAEPCTTQDIDPKQSAIEESFTPAPVIEVPTITVSFVDEPTVDESAIATAAPEEHAEESVDTESRKDIELPAEGLPSKTKTKKNNEQRQTGPQSLNTEQAQVPSIANPSTHEPLSGIPSISEQSVNAAIIGDSAEMIVQNPTEPAIGDVWFEPIGPGKTSQSKEKSKAIAPDDEVESIKLVEEAKPVEEPNPVGPTEPDSELEGVKPADVTELKSTGEEERNPMEESMPVEEGPSPVDESEVVERPKLVEELTLVEDPILSEAPTIVKEPKLVNESTLVEELQPTEERKLVEELTLVEDPDLPSQRSHDIQTSNAVSGNTTQDPPQGQLEPTSPGKKSRKKKKKGRTRQDSNTSTLGVADSSKSVDEPIAVENSGAVNLLSSTETAPTSTNQSIEEEPLKPDFQSDTTNGKELESLPSVAVGGDVPIITETPVTAATTTIEDSHAACEAPLTGQVSGANEPVTFDVSVASDTPVTSEALATQETAATEKALVGNEGAMTNDSPEVVEVPMTSEVSIADESAAVAMTPVAENLTANKNPISSGSCTTDGALVMSDAPALGEVPVIGETYKSFGTDDIVINEPSREVPEPIEQEKFGVEVPVSETVANNAEDSGVKEEVNNDIISTPTYPRQAPGEEESLSPLPDANIEVKSSQSGIYQRISQPRDEELDSNVASPNDNKLKEDETVHQGIPYADNLEPIQELEISKDHPPESVTIEQLIQTPLAEDSTIKDESLTKQVPSSQDEVSETHETSDISASDKATMNPDDAVTTQSTSSTSKLAQAMETATSISERIKLPSAISRSQTELDHGSTDMLDTKSPEEMAVEEIHTRNEEVPESTLEKDVMANELASSNQALSLETSDSRDDTIPALIDANASGNDGSEVVDSTQGKINAPGRSGSEPALDVQASTEANDLMEESGKARQDNTENRDAEVHQDSGKPTAQEQVASLTSSEGEGEISRSSSTIHEEADEERQLASPWGKNAELAAISETDEPIDDATSAPVDSTDNNIAGGEQDNKEEHAGHGEEESVPEMQPDQDNGELSTKDVSGYVDTEPRSHLETLEEGQDTGSTKEDNDKLEEPKPVLEPPGQPEPHTIPQATVGSTGVVHPDSTVANSQDSRLLEEDTSVDLPRQAPISASDEVTPLCVPQSAPLTEERLSTERPVNSVEQETVREPNPPTDVLNVGPADVEEVTTMPASSEPMIGNIPQQVTSNSPMGDKADDGAMLSEEVHVTPSEQQDVLLPKDLATTQLNEQSGVTPDVFLPEGHDVPLPDETQLSEPAEQAEVTKETFDQALPQSQETAPVQSDEPPHHHLDDQPINLTRDLRDDSQPEQEPKSETVVQAGDSLTEPFQPNAAFAEEPHQEIYEDTTAGESAQAPKSIEPVENLSPQVGSGKKSKKKKKRKSQIEPESEQQPLLENTNQVQDPQESRPLHEEPPVLGKEAESQPIGENAPVVVQDEAIPEDLIPKESPSKKSKKKKKKRASQVDPEAELGHGTSSEAYLQQPVLPEGPPAKESTAEGISSELTEESLVREVPSEKSFLDMAPVAETPMQAFPIREAVPEGFPLEDTAREIASPSKLEEEPMGLSKAAELKEASLPDELKDETSVQEITQTGLKGKAPEPQEISTQTPIVQESMRQADDQPIAKDQKVVEGKESSQDIDSETIFAKESTSQEQTAKKSATTDIATVGLRPTLLTDQAPHSDASKDAEQMAETMPDLVSEHPRLADSARGTQNLDIDREAVGTVSEHIPEANRQPGSLATGQPEDIVEDVSTEQGNK